MTETQLEPSELHLVHHGYLISGELYTAHQSGPFNLFYKWSLGSVHISPDDLLLYLGYRDTGFKEHWWLWGAGVTEVYCLDISVGHDLVITHHKT
jgi:hypothetical protein